MRIFDTFLFDGELHLLAHRLAENYAMVDAFVLVEAGETYRGAPKELTFERHREQFAWASDKLRHVRLSGLGSAARSPVERASIQRDAVLLALADAESDDIVLLLDVDEIPSHSLLRRLRTEGLDAPRRLMMTRHYEWADAVAPRSPCCPAGDQPFPAATPRLRPGPWQTLSPSWHGQSGVAVPMRAMQTRSASAEPPRTPFEWRFGHVGHPSLPGAGRHFSSVDPAARLDRKLGRVFHAEWASDRAMRVDHLRRCRAHGVHHRGWWYAERPDGGPPDDVARLMEGLPDSGRAGPLPALWRRRLVRTWAWLRLWPAWPDRLVTAMDRHFDRVLLLSAVPLIAADLVRAAAGRLMPPRKQRRSSSHPHV